MTHDLHNRGPVYAASFQTTAATTTIADVLGIRASTASRVMVHEIKLAQPIEPTTTERPGIILLRGNDGHKHRRRPHTSPSARLERRSHGWQLGHRPRRHRIHGERCLSCCSCRLRRAADGTISHIRPTA